MNATPPRPRRKGIGCLPRLLILLLLGPLFVATVDLVFAPWIYSVGGQTRLLPVWAGMGIAQIGLRVHADRKALYVQSQGRSERADLEKYGWACVSIVHRQSANFFQLDG